MTNTSMMANGNWVKQTLHYLFIMCPTMKVVQWPWQLSWTYWKHVFGQILWVWMVVPEHPLETVSKNKQNPSEQTSRQGNLPSMSKVLDISSLRRQSHVALLCLLWFFIAFFHALLCLITFLNHPMLLLILTIAAYYQSSTRPLEDFTLHSHQIRCRCSRVVQLVVVVRVCGNITGHCVTLSCLLHCIAWCHITKHKIGNRSITWTTSSSTSRPWDRGIEWETRLVWTQPYLVHCIEKISQSRQVM